jgi:hypothetical protein
MLVNRGEEDICCVNCRLKLRGSTGRNGPWQETDSSGVPAGLGKQFGN